MTAQKPTLYYVGDPMCSWCYGFSPEFSQVVDNLNGSVEVEWVMGGLRAYNDEPITKLADFLKEHWEDVNHRTGVKFSYDILTDPDVIYDTEPACRAVWTVRQMAPDKTSDYFKSVQHAFYFKNKSPNKSETFVELAGQVGIDKATFSKLFESDEAKNGIKKDFAFSKQLGAAGFPSVILKKGDEYFLLARGFAEAKELEDSIRKLLL